MAEAIIQDDHGREDESYEYCKMPENDEAENSGNFTEEGRDLKKPKKNKNNKKPKTIFVESTAARSSTP
jgi:hypothetical protein